MFEKNPPSAQNDSDGTVNVEVLPMSEAQEVDYGPFTEAEVAVEEDDVIITIPLVHGVTTVRAHKAIVAAWATDNVAGKLLNDAKKLRP